MLCAGSLNGACFKCGVYGAASFGVHWAQNDWNGLSSVSLIDNNSDPNFVFESWTPNPRTQDAGRIVGNAAVGYQIVRNRLYLGGEVSGTFRPRRDFFLNDSRSFSHLTELGLPPHSTIYGTSHTKTKVSLGCSEFDIDLKPGVLVCKNLLLYARTGLSYTQLKMESFGKWTEFGSEGSTDVLTVSGFLRISDGNTGVLTATGSSRNRQNKVGYRVGFGGEYLLTQHLGFSMDYLFSDYGKIKTVAEGSNSGVLDNFSQVYGVHAPEVKITTHTVMAGLVVHY